jgi:hypothetical protein
MVFLRKTPFFLRKLAKIAGKSVHNIDPCVVQLTSPFEQLIADGLLYWPGPEKNVQNPRNNYKISKK